MQKMNKDKRNGWLAAAVVLVLGCYVVIGYWGSESIPCRAFHWDGDDLYNLQAAGLARGQLNLPVEPRPELLALQNPYDPIANEPYRLHDATLYNGKYYSYFGITPALVFFLPLRLIGLPNAPTGFAVILFGSVGLLSALSLLRLFLKQRGCVPDQFSLILAVLALGFCNTGPFVLRHPAMYEVAISCGYAFLLLGLYLLLSGSGSDRPSWWRLGTGSLCLALAVGGRPHLVFAAPLLAAVFLFVTAQCREESRKRVGWAALILFAPYTAYGLLLAGYNYLRFGSPTDFGWRYQLAGLEVAKLPVGLYLVPTGLYMHLWHWFKLNGVFPFVHFQWQLPFIPPSGLPLEVICGAFVANPFLLILLLMPFVLVAALRDTDADAAGRNRSQFKLHVAILFLLPMIGMAFILVCSYLGLSTMRYEMDYGTLFLLPALVTWLYCLETLRGRLWHWPMLVIGRILVVIGCVINMGLGLAAYDDGAQIRQNWCYLLIGLACVGLSAGLVAWIGFGVRRTRRERPTAMDTTRPTARREIRHAG